MTWNKDYKKSGKIWGENPSELAKAAVRYLKKNKPVNESLNLLDIGCGYGRDAFYLSDNLQCNIFGIDVSERAIEIALNTATKTKKHNITFQSIDFASLGGDKYDIIFASNVYQVLYPDERETFKNVVKQLLQSGSLLFLSTLSKNDPEHYGKGVEIVGETNSFKDEKYLHFCTIKELMQDFGFLNIKELYEQKYDEPRSNGEIHHHVSWILVGSAD